MPSLIVKLLAAVCLMVLTGTCANAQLGLKPAIVAPETGASVGSRLFNFSQALQTAIDNFPSITASAAREEALRGSISLAKTAYLPRLDVVMQENRGSTSEMNSIYVPVLHLPLVNSTDVRSKNFGRSIWSGTTGAVLNWELIDFGLRRARVRAAEAEHGVAVAGVQLTRFDVEVATADAFFALLGAEQKVKAEKANVDRMQAFASQVHALVGAELRPGVDASRADAEVARAQDEFIGAEQSRDVGKAMLAERMGLAGAAVEVVQQPFVVLPQLSVAPTLPSFEFHPLVIQNTAIINTVLAKEKAISREWFPHVAGLAAMQARGSGVNRGSALSQAGFLPDVPNWMVGLTATFPVMDIFEIRIRHNIERANERAARARFAQTMQILTGQDAVAKAEIVGAQRRAQNAPFFLKSAQDTVKRAQIRYNVGLGTVVEVAEAERLLTDAQVIYDLASIAVWRAYLAAAVAHGDLTPFIKLTADSGSR